MSGGNKVHDGSHPHFITSTVTYWLPIFCREDYFHVLADSFRHCVREKGLVVHAYVLMPNHFHAIASQIDGRLSDVMRDLKGYTSRQLAKGLADDGRTVWLRALRRAGGDEVAVKLWQDDYHPEQVHSKEFCQQKLDYIHANPVRAGYVDDPCDWRYSSAGFYYRDSEPLIPVEPVDW